jgi:phosphatidylserine/phosphatidylglycerophosphate/cardiolipin synthase-like enzyme
VWDAETGAVVYVLRHAGAVRGARCCADATRVLTWSDDGMVRVWLVNLPALIERASARTIWSLSNQERDAFYLPTLEPTRVAAAPTVTPLPTLTPLPTSAGVEYTPPTPAASDWWQVYFTEPVQDGEPDQNMSGIDQPLVRAIEGAGQTIDAALFEIDLPSVTEALRSAYGRGVRVRVLTDDEHGFEDEASTIGQLIVAGIPVVDDGRAALMHNMFVVVDGREVWAGSWNPTVNDTFRNNNNLIAITSTELASVYTREFEEMFVDGQFGSTSPSFESPAEQSALVDGTAIQAYFAPEDRVIDQVTALISGARSRVRFMAFTFTDDALGQAVLDAAGRGVAVDGIVEARGSETSYNEFPDFYCNQLSVRQDGNAWLFHHQVFIIDDEIVVIGSPAFASNDNDDNVLIIRSDEIAAQYNAEFEQRWQEARVPEDISCD